MTAESAELWNAVKASYDQDGLVALTNIRDRSATAIDDAVGGDAALAVTNLWGVYAQSPYPTAPVATTDPPALEVAKLAVIAVLWRRGGASSTIEQVKWDEVFGDSGLIATFRKTRARAHGAPSSNSGVQQAPETDSSGRRVAGWSDDASLPTAYLPRSTPADVNNT
ncbi:MAG TPA: hypothetical protein VNM34_15090 [Verrucomicrobiae bacterium]|nr:hypothetical protein [Verrucomicrobiae bacterium]